MRGRKPIPTKIHLLQGGVKKTHRAKDDRKNEPKPSPKIPPCPKHLDKTARKEWKRMASLLSAVKILTDMDMAILASYCQAYSTWATATLKVQEIGMVVKTSNGVPMQNPYLPILNKANEHMIRALIELGATPSARSRVKTTVSDKDESPEEEFLKDAK